MVYTIIILYYIAGYDKRVGEIYFIDLSRPLYDYKLYFLHKITVNPDIVIRKIYI